MIHNYTLRNQPFNQIKSGIKTIEMRLYDDKRKNVRIGDTITFTNTSNHQQISVLVTDLFIFDSFKELYEKLPLTKCGYLPSQLEKASYKDMEQYYLPALQEKHQVVGIQIQLLP